MMLRKHGRRRKNLHSIEDIGTGTPAAIPGRDWVHEHDVKAFCAHCRNWRSSKHVDEHALIVAGGERPKGYRP